MRYNLGVPDSDLMRPRLQLTASLTLTLGHDGEAGTQSQGLRESRLCERTASSRPIYRSLYPPCAAIAPKTTPLFRPGYSPRRRNPSVHYPGSTQLTPSGKPGQATRVPSVAIATV